MPSWRSPPTSARSKSDLGGAALAAWRGEPDQGRRERFHNLLQKRHLDPKPNMKESAPTYKANPAQHCSAQMMGELPPWMSAAPSSVFIPGPLWREQSPTGPKQPRGGRHFSPLIAPSRCALGQRVSHAPPACSPMLGLSCSPTCHPQYTEHFLGAFFGLRVDGLIRLALSSHCLRCDHQIRNISPQAKHKDLIKRKTLKTDC